jgi:hypothetical protein
MLNSVALSMCVSCSWLYDSIVFMYGMFQVMSRRFTIVYLIEKHRIKQTSSAFRSSWLFRVVETRLPQLISPSADAVTQRRSAASSRQHHQYLPFITTTHALPLFLLPLLLLQSEMEGGRLTWLLANTLCERTYLAQRRLQA